MCVLESSGQGVFRSQDEYDTTSSLLIDIHKVIYPHPVLELFSDILCQFRS